MLHTLLHLHLDAALVLSDVECHLSQPSGNDLAENDGKGRQQQQYPSQPGVEPPHQQERATQPYHRDYDLGQRICTDSTYLFDVLR